LSNSFNITATTPAGVYPLTVTGTLTNPDYFVSFRLPGEWTVNKRPLTIAAKSKTIPYGETPVLEHEIVTGELVNGDVLTGEIYCAPPFTIGDHAITQGTLSAGPNYIITFIPGTLTVGITDASISSISVDDINTNRSGNNFDVIAPCGANSVEVNVSADRYATVTINNTTQNPCRVNLPNYGNNTFTINVRAQAGNTETYTLTIYRSIPVEVAFYDRFYDVLTVPVYVEGVGTVNTVEWFHNGVRLDRDTAKGYLETKEAGAYYALLNGQFRTCEVIKTGLKSGLLMSVFPNPVDVYGEVTVVIENPGGEELRNAQLQMHGMDGRLLKTLPVTGNQNKLKVIVPAYPGVVVLKLKSDTGNQEVKLIVK
jgi:hypothetical protein